MDTIGFGRARGAGWLTSALIALITGCSGAKDGETGQTGETGTEPGETFTVLGDASNLPAAALLSIWGTSDTDVFIVGADDGTGPVVLHWDGAAWMRLETGSSGDLWWVWSDGGDVVWMTGENGRLLTYTRSTGAFTEETIADPVFKLFGIWGTGPDDIYTVGGDIFGNNDGVVLHWDGAAWTVVHTVSPSPSNGSARQAFKVWGSSPSDVWVVGTGALVTHWDGAAWTDLPQPVYQSIPLTTVHGSGADNVFAVGGYGNAAVIHNDGTGWFDISPPPQDIVPGMNGVYATSDRGTAMCGVNGSIYWNDGTTWSLDPRPRPTARDFHACWIDDLGAVWAVGGDLSGLTEGVVAYGGDRVQPITP